MAIQKAKTEEIEEFRGVPFTRKEAEAATQEFIRTGVELRHRMLELYERQAHKALGYADFEEYSTARLGMNWDNRYLNNLRSWARVERDVHLPPVHAQPGGSLSVEVAKRPLSKHVAEELAKLPSETRREAYQEAVALGATGKGELPCIKHIVTRRLNEINGIAPKAPSPAPEAPKAETPAPVVEDPKPVPDVVAPASPPSAPKPAAPAPPVRVVKEAEPAPVAKEDLPKTQWLEALYSTTTWLENDEIDATPQYRKEASTYLVQLSVWVATGS